MAMQDMPRLDLEVLNLPDGTRVEVYRRDDELAVGQAVSVHLPCGTEVLRFDLDRRSPHEHWGTLPRQPRMHLPPDLEPDVIRRLAAWAVREHVRPAARNGGLHLPPRKDLVGAAAWTLETLRRKA